MRIPSLSPFPGAARSRGAALGLAGVPEAFVQRPLAAGGAGAELGSGGVWVRFAAAARCQGTSVGVWAALPGGHMFCLSVFRVHDQSNTMTIPSEQKPSPFPRSQTHHLCVCDLKCTAWSSVSLRFFFRASFRFSLHRYCFSGHHHPCQHPSLSWYYIL